MFAEAWCGGADAPWGLFEDVGAAEHGELAEVGVLDGGPEAALVEGFVVPEVEAGVEGAAHDVVLAGGLPDFGAGAFEHPRVDDGVDGFAGAGLEGGEGAIPCGVLEGFVADHVDEASPVGAGEGGDFDEAIGDGIDAAGESGDVGGGAVLDAAGESVGEDAGAAAVDVADLGGEAGDIDELSCSVDFVGGEGAHGCDRGHGAALEGRCCSAEFEGLAVGEAVAVHFGTHGVDDEVVEGVVAVGPVVAEVGDGDDGDVFVAGEGGVVDAEPLFDAGWGSGDDEVGHGDEGANEVSRGGLFEVDDDGLFVGVEVLEGGAAFGPGLVVEEWGEVSGGVAAWSFDFDDAGAEVGEEFGAVRACEVAGEVEDGDALECVHGAPVAVGLVPRRLCLKDGSAVL